VKNPGQAERLAVILDAYRDAWRAARSYRALARTLNAAGVKAPAGGRWTAKAATRVAEALGLYVPTPRGPRTAKTQTNTTDAEMTAAA
jgi:hypothetical protein